MATDIPVSDSKPVLILGSIAAGATALVTVLASLDGVPKWAVAVAGGIATVATVIGGYLTQAKTAPWANVAALKVDATGETVAGPASPLSNGSPVDVTAESPLL